ncbi:MAG: hypothetical protein AAFO79_08050, partial [Pseudomonadota bacterium]
MISKWSGATLAVDTHVDAQRVASPTKPEGTEAGHIPAGNAGLFAWAAFGLAIAIAGLHLYFNLFAEFSPLWRNAMHFAGFIVLCALTLPLAASGPARWLDLLFALAVAASAIYLVAMEDAIYARGVTLETPEWIAGSMLIL